MVRKRSSTPKTKQAPEKRPDITSRIVPVSNTEESVTALFYGRSGTGKTTLAGSFPKVLLLDFKEEGTDSIRDIPGIDVLHIKEWIDVEDTFWLLEGGESPYETVVFDTISGMQDLAIIEAKARNGQAPDAPTSQRLWGEVSGIMKEWIYNYRDLPMNVVFLAHERVKEPEGEDELDEGQLDPEVGPNVIPSISKTLCAAVKVIGNTYIRQSFVKSKRNPKQHTRRVEYCLRVGPHPFYITKIRAPKSHKVPERIKDADFDKIKKVMSGIPLTKPKSKTTTTKEE